MFVVPDARDVCISASALGNKRCLGDGESAGDTSALFVVFEGERTVDVSLAGAGALHGRQDDSVLQVGGANTDGLK